MLVVVANSFWLATLASAQSLAAQADVYAGFHAGLHGGATFGFTQALCPKGESLYGANVRLRGFGFASVDLEHSVHSERAEDCVSAPEPPIRDVGPDQRAYNAFPAGVSGYPYGTTSIRFELEPRALGSSIRPLVFVGVGRIWTKDIGVRSYGAGISGQVARLGVFARWTRTVFSFPYEQVTDNYFDGKLVSTERLPRISSQRHNAFDLGAEIHVASLP
jgi:hypothetical protein